ncbi:DMT family transporter [Spirochaeta cellobiosiphila]|uniref:DMT family transporter n=1 Tax=Spirochaeta cellobiosiphila TaxID=504483 RepID=UPI00040A5839|nr:DMT family transporter [Spirochaeta cellobiosiphila]
MKFIIVATLVGGFISVMVAINGQLQSLTNPMISLLFIYLSGYITSFIGNPFIKPYKKLEKKPPLIYNLSGVLGLGIVYLNNIVFLKGGVVLALTGMLAGQTLVATILSPHRKNALFGMLFIVVGSLIIALSAHINIVWIMVAWTCGAALMFQIYMNTKVGEYYGQNKMLQRLYLSGLIGISSIIGITNSELFHINNIKPILYQVPFYLLIGGGVIGVLINAGQTMLMRMMKPVQMILSINLGQLLLGVVIDFYIRSSLSFIHLVGIALVIIGLIVDTITGKKVDSLT